MQIWNCKLCNVIKSWMGSASAQEEIESRPPQGVRWHNFQTDYIKYKANCIRSLVNMDGRIGSGSTCLLKGYHSKDGTPNSEYCYMQEFISYIDQNNRKFIVTVTGISDPDSPPKNLSRVEDFPALKEDIGGFALIVQEVSNDWTITGEGITFKSTEDTAWALHKKASTRVTEAANNSESVTDIMNWAEEKNGIILMKRFKI